MAQDKENEFQKLEHRIAKLQQQLATLQEEESRFGTDSYGIGTVIRYQMKWGQEQVWRAALKYGDDKWVTTSSTSSYASHTWKALVRKDLMSAVDGKVEVATDWSAK